MPKILVIDDDPHLRKILSTVLARHNFEVVAEQDGASGLRQARLIRPALIILDIIMPGMDGFEVAKNLRNSPYCAHIPIMILTAFATPYARRQAAKLDIEAFVTKPFKVDELVNRVNRITAAVHSAAAH